MNFFAVLVVVAASLLQSGYGLKCYQYSCTNSSMRPSGPCPAPTEFTCEAPNDRCMVMRMTMNVGEMDMRNCTMSVACDPSAVAQACKGANQTGGLVSCEMGCCQGDLCNTGGPMPTALPPTGPTGPSGADLSCYECSSEGMGPNGTGKALKSCENLPKRTCGGTIPVMDRCMTVKTTVKHPKTGQLIDQEMKNCSNIYMCGDFLCKSMNQTGELVKCALSCCVGNLCNTDTPPPAAGQTALASTLVIFSGIFVVLLKLF